MQRGGIDDRAINPGAVKGTEILNEDTRLVAQDLRMAARHRHVVEKDCVRGIATDGDLGRIELEDVAGLGPLDD